jgi:putative ABC transport system ATP-binding protein
MTMEPVLEAKDVAKVYRAAEDVYALRGVNLKVYPGDFLAVIGSSGSGKSTLMNILGCLDRPTSGTYLLDGVDTRSLSKDQLAELRNKKIGFVFQGFNLLPRTSAIENVELPLVYDSTVSAREARQRAEESLARVGLAHRSHHEPSQLSGGQQQRVAIARALVNRPRLILADEPTGNLDTPTSMDVLSILQELNDNGVTVVLVTHEPDIARCARRIFEMSDGQVKRDEPVKDRLIAADWKAEAAAAPPPQPPAPDELPEPAAVGQEVSR